MSDLFKDIIPSILQTKKNVLDNEGDYVPFVVNRALSFHYDCIMYANQMNMCSGIDKKLQYDYYLNTVRSYRRPYQKWLKKETIENLNAVKEYYKYSDEKAKEALSILSDEQISVIKEKLDKGGTNGKSKRIDRGDTG
jgi:hypothetical protein